MRKILMTIVGLLVCSSGAMAGEQELYGPGLEDILGQLSTAVDREELKLSLVNIVGEELAKRRPEGTVVEDTLGQQWRYSHELAFVDFIPGESLGNSAVPQERDVTLGHMLKRLEGEDFAMLIGATDEHLFKKEHTNGSMNMDALLQHELRQLRAEVAADLFATDVQVATRTIPLRVKDKVGTGRGYFVVGVKVVKSPAGYVPQDCYDGTRPYLGLGYGSAWVETMSGTNVPEAKFGINFSNDLIIEVEGGFTTSDDGDRQLLSAAFRRPIGKGFSVGLAVRDARSFMGKEAPYFGNKYDRRATGYGPSGAWDWILASGKKPGSGLHLNVGAMLGAFQVEQRFAPTDDSPGRVTRDWKFGGGVSITLGYHF